MTKKIYLETLKSALGCSILHYSRQSVSGIVFSETTLKYVENFVFTQKPLCLVMNNPFNNFWQYVE